MIAGFCLDFSKTHDFKQSALAVIPSLIDALQRRLSGQLLTHFVQLLFVLLMCLQYY